MIQYQTVDDYIFITKLNQIQPMTNNADSDNFNLLNWLILLIVYFNWLFDSNYKQSGKI